MDWVKRLAELRQMRKDGALTPSELKELGELQDKETSEGKEMTVTDEQLKELVGGAVNDATKELKDEIKVLKESHGEKMKHGKVEYSSPKIGDKPEIQNERKEAIGKDFLSAMQGAEAKALTTLTDGAGGILIPVEFTDTILFYAGTYGTARRVCDIMPMSSKTMQIDAFATGAVSYWVTEADSSTESSPTFSGLELAARDLATLITASKQFVEDLKDSRGIDIFDRLAEVIAESMAKAEDEQFLNGTGSPFTGLLGHASIPAIVMDSTKTSFADMTYDDLINVTRGVPMKFKKGRKLKWFMHQDIIAHVEKLKDDNGNPIFKRSWADGESDRLLNFEIEFMDDAPATADDDVSTKFLAFGDAKYMAMGDRRKNSTEFHTSGTVNSVNLIEKRRIAIQVTERVGFAVKQPLAFRTLKTAAS